MSKAKIAKFQGKEYKQLEENWEIKENSTSMTFAGEEVQTAPAEGAKAATVAGYIIDVQIAYNKEDDAYPCFAEFFKIAKKAVDFKAYTAARKDAEASADEDENVDDIVPKYAQKQWDEVSLGEKFELLEPSMDLTAEFDVEMDDLDKFTEKMKEFGIEIPESLKDDLKA
ncbi:MAG TPA: hypothetical protein VKM55_01395 [Candidatus Lokiarchaeia archaeon]|nr:hypothetical protein [Candidatus Lokiarchaeia archaeon]